MKVIKTPWKKEFLNLVQQTEKTIKITSPFVKENVCDDILNIKKKNVRLDLITSFKLMNIYSGSLDIGGLEKILKSNGNVRNLSRIHSKIFIFDDKKAIISSSNLTNGGLLNNFEYGIYSDNIKTVEIVKNDFEALFHNENIGVISENNIVEVRQLLSKMPKIKKISIPIINIDNPEDNFDIIDLPDELISSTLRGWKFEIFICLEQIPKNIFSLQDINKFENHLKSIYPNNHHILDKIRQQLQKLRDLGLLEFLGNGVYRKLWTINRN
ncbi:MAG: phospholipase D-like domain-containing protein [Candidatus Cloacimonadota bacterium]|nr:phospholipase D-like domain-containing protein [Candidatus Cloacimonadota bacterium]